MTVEPRITVRGEQNPAYRPSAQISLEMLIEKDRVAVRVGDHETGRAFPGFQPGFLRQRHAIVAQRRRQGADVSSAGYLLRVAVPPRVEGQCVALEHALEQADGRGLVLQDQPALILIAANSLIAELFVKCATRPKIPDSQRDREISKFHLFTPCMPRR